ncbi:hypothetical protein MNV49_006457 [Pseudohyphozyma bogoriensis]|nr:hypothetical protein MNV49_006457 [Pseudohyphozyma bogoriensis]
MATTGSTASPEDDGRPTKRTRAGRPLSLAFPYDSLYRNERSYLKCLSLSSGLPALNYLEEFKKQKESSGADPEWTSWIAFPFSSALSRPPSPPLESLGGMGNWDRMEAEIGATTVSALVREFLRSLYPLWPTFMLTEFVAKLKDPVARQEVTFVALVLSVTAVARRHLGEPGTPADQIGIDHFTLYRELKQASPKSDWSSLSAIQTLFYFSHFCFGGVEEFGVVMAHTLINEAVSRSFDCGLHRSVDPYADAFSPAELEARRRTLWAVYCGDKISAAFGRPSLLRLSDVDVCEVTVDSPDWSERPLSSLSLLPYHRANVRLHTVLEKVLEKINISSCNVSPALRRLTGNAPLRRRETTLHDDPCEANHTSINFDEELRFLDAFQAEDLPESNPALEDDNLYHIQVERLRTLSAFIRVLIYRHWVTIANSDLSTNGATTEHNAQLLHWCQDLLSSQRKILSRGSFTDFGSTASYQISQTGRALLPMIYINRLSGAGHDTDLPLQQALTLSIKLLRDLATRFVASTRSLDILLLSASRLDIQTSLESSSIDAMFTEGEERRAASSTSWIKSLPINAPLIPTAIPDNLGAWEAWEGNVADWDWLSSLGGALGVASPVPTNPPAL